MSSVIIVEYLSPTVVFEINRFSHPYNCNIALGVIKKQLVAVRRRHPSTHARGL